LTAGLVATTGSLVDSTTAEATSLATGAVTTGSEAADSPREAAAGVVVDSAVIGSAVIGSAVIGSAVDAVPSAATSAGGGEAFLPLAKTVSPAGVLSAASEAGWRAGVVRPPATGAVSVVRRLPIVRLPEATISRRWRPVARPVRAVEAVELSRARSRAVAKASSGAPSAVAASATFGSGVRPATWLHGADEPADAGIEIMVISWSRRR
jgi:hypothetical protein